MFLDSVVRRFKPGDADTPAEPALALEQYRVLSAQAPILYLVFIVNSVSIAYALPATLPWMLKFGAPGVLLAVSIVRLIVWLRLKRAAPTADEAQRKLRKARVLVGLISAGFSFWSLALFDHLDTAARAPVVLLIFMGSIGSARAIASLPGAARLILLLTSLPIALRLLMTGDAIPVCVGANLCLILVVLARMMNAHYRDFVKLVNARTTIVAEQERTRNAETAALAEHAKAAQIAARFDTALNNMSQGLCFFDGAQQLIVCNRRYVDMYGLPPERVRPGTTLREIVDLRFRAGSFPAMTTEEYLAWRDGIVVSHQPSDSVVELQNGRVFEIRHRPMPDRGWVATHEDVTERYNAERELTDAKANAERAEHAAKAAHATLVEALDVVPEGIVVFDADDRFVLWNRRYAELYPTSQDIMVPGVRFEDVLRTGLARGQYPEAEGRAEEWLQERLALHAQPQSTHEQQLPDDRWLRIEERRTARGGSIGVRINITDLKRREASFRLLFEENPLPMWVTDAETMQLLAVNAATCQHYGHSREHLLATTADTFLIPEHRARLREEFRNGKGTGPVHETSRHVTADGRMIDVAIEARPLRYHGRDALVAVGFDMTERKRAEEQIAYLARHDALTQLANRGVILEQIDQAFKAVRRHGHPFAVFVLDLDRFKIVNDSLGHPVGDALLKAVAQRLQSCVRESDMVARLGGDEFAIVQSVGADQQNGAIILADRLIEALTAPYDLDGHKVIVGASIGIALAPHDGTDGDQLLKSADLALYRAKSDGRNCYRFFEKKMEIAARARHALEAELRRALAGGEFELHYQPIVEIGSHRICSVEALARWRHPQRGIVEADQFIPVTEEIGLIIPLGAWALRQACRDASHWPPDVKLAVNLSATQFVRGGLVELVSATLVESGLAPQRLELEITESVLLEHNAGNLAQLHELKRLGVSIVLDDFGIGYSSLGYLTMFPFDKIKIDRSLVGELAHRSECAAIVCAVIRLGHSLGIATAAEGVETEEQLTLVRTAGSREAQGYLFGRPVPAAELVFRAADDRAASVA